MAPSSQKRQALVHVRAIRAFLSEFDFEELSELVGATQNEGEGNDGSISEGEWLKLKAVRDAVVELSHVLEKPAAEYGLVRSVLDE